jgi:uncharacterized protein YjcR
MTDTQKQFIREMRRAGLSYAAIADSAGLSQNTVKSFCRREHIDAADDIGGDPDVCRNCGNPLEQTHGKKKKRFCNDKCRSDWWNHNRGWARHKNSFRLICHFCGAEFDSYGNRNRKYCGRDCYIQSRYGEGLP